MKNIKCEKCGSTLMKYNERTGELIFRFGINLAMPPPRIVVAMDMTEADLRMQCLKSSCRRKHPNHWNTININDFKKSKTGGD